VSSNPTSPGPQFSDILDLTSKMQMDIRALNSKLTTIRSWISAQPDSRRVYEHTCPVPHCQFGFASASRLAEHLANVHGRPKEAA
jgi:hypothetical protein